MLPRFHARVRPCELPEWMDQPCSFEDFRACLLDLDAANQWTLGMRPTLAWLSALPAQATPLRVLDVGFGSGAMLRAIAQWAAKRGARVELMGVDLNPYAERAAKQFAAAGERIEFVTGNAYSLPDGVGFDVIISSLTTHHMEEAETVRFVGWMEATARVGWFINDLYRGAAPFVAFKALAATARWHRFVQHDGPVSIRRSFREEDWQRMCVAAGVRDARIERWVPWRLCVGRMR